MIRGQSVSACGMNYLFQGASYLIRLSHLQPDNLTNARLQSDWRLRQALQGYEEVVKKVHKCSNTAIPLF